MTDRPSPFAARYPEAARRLIRNPVHIAAQISGSAIVRHAIVVTDITVLGLQAEVRSALNPDQWCMVTIPTLRPIGGRVAWYGSRRIGFAFDDPLARAVLCAVMTLSVPPSDAIRTLAEF